MTVPIMQRWWVQSLVGVCVAIVVPVATHKMEWTRSIGEDVAVGIGVWVVGMIFQIAYSLHRFHVERLEVKHILQVVNENDRFLLEMQARLREIATRTLNGKPNRVFLDCCRYNLEHSLKTARRAAQDGELEVQDHHFDTLDTVLAAFDGCDDRTYRCVWLVEEGEDLFDGYWRQYMKSLIDLNRKACRGERIAVRILFVVDDAAQLRRESVKVLLGFVAEEREFSYCIITAEDYRGRARDGRLDAACIDFGVYGDHLLFRTISYDPHVGVFSDQSASIERYRAMHDAGMDAASAVQVEGALPAGVTVEEFLTCDRLEGGGSGTRSQD